MTKDQAQPESFLDFDLESVPELSAVDDGEYKVTLQYAEVKSGETNGRSWKQVSCRYTIEDEPAAFPIFHTVWLPTEETETAERIRTLNDFRIWAQAHGMTTSSGFDVTEAVGTSAWALVGQRDYQGNTQNTIKRFLRAS